MLLKKQTVWLLTMLSLVVVLSVYYVTSPENTGDDLAYQDTATEEATEGVEGTESESAATQGEEGVVIEESSEEAENGTVISSVASDELFTALRLEMDDHRSKLVTDLQAIMASSEVSAEQKSDAYDKMIEVQEVSAKERVLETLIKAESEEYKDVLVRADGNSVRIIVKSENHTRAQANKIIQLVKTELGKRDVAVEFSNK
jgi:stage III sporulation protein AH